MTAVSEVQELVPNAQLGEVSAAVRMFDYNTARAVEFLLNGGPGGAVGVRGGSAAAGSGLLLDLVGPTPSAQRKCAACDTSNAAERQTCFVCDTPFPAGAARYAGSMRVIRVGYPLTTDKCAAATTTISLTTRTTTVGTLHSVGYLYSMAHTYTRAHTHVSIHRQASGTVNVDPIDVCPLHLCAFMFRLHQ